MRISVGLRQQITWLALCAITFVAIAPTISHWIAASTGLPWVEVCSASSIKRIAFDTGSTPAPTDDHNGTTHCPFCRLQNHLPVLPTIDAALFQFTPIHDHVRTVFGTSPLYHKHFWMLALSRAPPLSPS